MQGSEQGLSRVVAASMDERRRAKACEGRPLIRLVEVS